MIFAPGTSVSGVFSISQILNGIKKNLDNRFDYQGFTSVGMTGFEPATTRPPDVYSNRAELHPESCLNSGAKVIKYFYSAKLKPKK